jgi:antitoxin YefM
MCKRRARGNRDKKVALPHGITYGRGMKTVTATSARSGLYNLIDAALRDREPIQITGKRGNAVLVAEEDWRAIEETLYLQAIPGMAASIRKGMKEPIDKCSPEIDL